MRVVVIPQVDLLTKKRPLITGLESLSKVVDISITIQSRMECLKDEDRTRYRFLMEVSSAGLVSSLMMAELFREQKMEVKLIPRPVVEVPEEPTIDWEDLAEKLRK